MADSMVGIPLWLMIGGGLLGLLVIGGVFALIYWMMSRGKDDEATD